MSCIKVEIDSSHKRSIGDETSIEPLCKLRNMNGLENTKAELSHDGTTILIEFADRAVLSWRLDDNAPPILEHPTLTPEEATMMRNIHEILGSIYKKNETQTVASAPDGITEETKMAKSTKHLASPSSSKKESKSRDKSDSNSTQKFNSRGLNSSKPQSVFFSQEQINQGEFNENTQSTVDCINQPPTWITEPMVYYPSIQYVRGIPPAPEQLYPSQTDQMYPYDMPEPMPMYYGNHRAFMHPMMQSGYFGLGALPIPYDALTMTYPQQPVSKIRLTQSELNVLEARRLIQGVSYHQVN